MSRIAKILVAHEEPGVNDIMETVFKKKLRHVEVVADSERAGLKGLIASIKKTRPDMVFFNPARIGESRPEVMRGVCKDLRRRFRKLRVVILTSRTDFHGLSSLDILADGLIHTPAQLREYVGAVHTHLPFAE